MCNSWTMPKWNPSSKSLRRFSDDEFKVRYSALRKTSQSFTQRKDVRDYIFKRDGYSCVFCGSKENLQIDHVVEVLRFARLNPKRQILLGEVVDYLELNSEDNLQTACIKCNSGKIIHL